MILPPTNFIPGLGKKIPYSPMNQAVLDYRSDYGNPLDLMTRRPIKEYHRKMIPRPLVHGTRDLDDPPFPAKVPSKYPLKEFQHDGIFNATDILHTYGGCIIADDMGLGKTIEAIVLSEVKKVPSLLIVVEAKTLIQWQSQYYKWTGKLLQVINTKMAAKNYANSGDNAFAICSYDMLDSINKSLSWGMIIYDEVQKLRSRVAKMSLAARELRERTPYVVVLTGTLQWGYVRDLWNPLRITFRYLFGNADEFDFTYCGAFFNEHGGKDNKGFKSSDGIDRSEELAIRLSYVTVRRTRVDVKAELPAFERNIIRIPCSAKAKTALHAFLRKELPYMNAIMSTTNEKTEPVLEFWESLDNAIIFTWTKTDVSLLAGLIAKTGKKVYAITGSTAKAERVAIITQAAQEKATIVATIDSCGVGVDGLQHVSSDIIFHSLSHSPKLHLQAESRAYRIGAVNPVRITYFVMQDSADELVISILDSKSSQDGSSATESDKKAFSSLKMDDAAMQAVLDEWVKNATDEVETGDTNSDGWSDTDDDES